MFLKYKNKQVKAMTIKTWLASILSRSCVRALTVIVESDSRMSFFIPMLQEISNPIKVANNSARTEVQQPVLKAKP